MEGIFTSTDLINWTEGQTIFKNILDVKWEDNQFFVTSQGEYGDNYSHISFSADGANWSSSTIDDSIIYGISSKDNQYIAVGSNGHTYKGLINNESKTLLLQVGADEGQFKLTLSNMSLVLEGLNSINVEIDTNVTRTLNLIDNALSDVTSERTKLGAYHNALQHLQSNVTNYEQNLINAESRIRDSDYALAA